MPSTDDPFVQPPPKEVPLRDAPLVRVLAQLRFPEVLSIEKREFVAPFQEALRPDYPVLRAEQTRAVVMARDGVIPAHEQTTWRFSDLEGIWRVTLAPSFLAIETRKYESRKDFLTRLRSAVEALDQHIQPKQLDRLGVRYIDRICGDAVDEIASLVRREVLGVTATDAAGHVVHSVSESLFDLQDANVIARWGRLPEGMTTDPSVIEPVNEKSWILDLDMFSVKPSRFTVEASVAEAERFAERLYTVFRWIVTERFLERYGGTT